MAGAADAALAAIGLTLIAAGLAWIGWAGWTLRRAGPRLVDEGPFRFGRHPMYLGSVLALLGVALLLGQPAVAAAAMAYALLVDRWRIPCEEQRLRQAFGGWYLDYAASTRRWL